MLNAGKYNHRIQIYRVTVGKDSAGFSNEQESLILETKANVKTTRGITLIKNDSDFEKAWTNFTIRYPKTIIDRDCQILFHGKRYSIEYLNNVDERMVELEMQCKEITH